MKFPWPHDHDPNIKVCTNDPMAKTKAANPRHGMMHQPSSLGTGYLSLLGSLTTIILVILIDIPQAGSRSPIKRAEGIESI